MSEQWPDITAYAAQLGVSRFWVRDAVTARRVHHTRVGKHVRFSPEDQEANRAMWAQAPLRTPAAALIRIPSRRRSAA